MSLEECLRCVKKDFIYTGIKSSPCVYSLKDVKGATNEVDEAVSKGDCVANYPLEDEGIFGWGLSTRADVLIIVAVFFGVLIFRTFKNRFQELRIVQIVQNLGSMCTTLVASGIFPTLLALRGAPHGRFRSFCADLATRFAQYMQSNSSGIGVIPIGTGNRTVGTVTGTAGDGTGGTGTAGDGTGGTGTAGDGTGGTETVTAGAGAGTQEPLQHVITIDTPITAPPPSPPPPPFHSQVLQCTHPDNESSASIVDIEPAPAVTVAVSEEVTLSEFFDAINTIIEIDNIIAGGGLCGT